MIAVVTWAIVFNDDVRKSPMQKFAENSVVFTFKIGEKLTANFKADLIISKWPMNFGGISSF